MLLVLGLFFSCVWRKLFRPILLYLRLITYRNIMIVGVLTILMLIPLPLDVASPLHQPDPHDRMLCFDFWWMCPTKTGPV